MAFFGVTELLRPSGPMRFSPGFRIFSWGGKKVMAMLAVSLMNGKGKWDYRDNLECGLRIRKTFRGKIEITASKFVLLDAIVTRIWDFL